MKVHWWGYYIWERLLLHWRWAVYREATIWVRPLYKNGLCMMTQILSEEVWQWQALYTAQAITLRLKHWLSANVQCYFCVQAVFSLIEWHSNNVVRGRIIIVNRRLIAWAAPRLSYLLCCDMHTNNTTPPTIGIYNAYMFCISSELKKVDTDRFVQHNFIVPNVILRWTHALTGWGGHAPGGGWELG